MEKQVFVDKLYQRLENGNVVVLTGAGMSTASGIRDFRGVNGLYKENINAEEILSATYFKNHPQEFYDFYRKYLVLNDDIKPNVAHELIKEYQDMGKIKAIITQNIDGLDVKVGCVNVIEIHGNANQFHCVECGSKYNISDITNTSDVPHCTKCDGVIRPNIVLYQEPLEDFSLWQSKDYIDKAKTLLVIGSSLRVYPAAGLVKNFYIETRDNQDKELYIINQGPTDLDGYSDIYRYDGDIIEVTNDLKIKKLSKKII